MTTDIADLGLAIHSESVPPGVRRLKDLEHQASRTEVAVDKLITATLRFASAYASWRVGEAVVRKYIDATAEAERMQAQLAAAIKSTGAVAGQTLEALNAHAAALQKITTYGDEAINSAQALLLTFTRIRGDEFPKATEAVLNLATAMHTDLKSAALQVGKALNDPILGMTALQRSGIQFSEAQKRLVKQFVETNDIVSAQKVILEELENQFGGSAEAARGTLGGALQSLENAFGDLFEVAGPGADDLRESVERLITKIQDPQFMQAVQDFGTAIFTLIGWVVDLVVKFDEAISNITRNIGPLVHFLQTTGINGISMLGTPIPQTPGSAYSGGWGSKPGPVEITIPGGGKPAPADLGPTSDQIAAVDKAQKAYDALTLSMRQKIAASELDLRTIGLTTDQITRLTNEHDVLQDAEKKGLKLTADQRAELVGYANELSNAQIEVRRLTEEQQQYEDVLSSLGDTIAEVFGGNIKTIDEFFDHLLGGFAKIGQGNIAKLFTPDGLAGLFDTPANDNVAVGNVIKEATAEGVFDGLGDFVKNNKGNIGAAAGGLGMGYQSQNPLMGALGGALAGASAGPWGAIIGGVAGLVGGLLGMHDALVKARKAVDDNRASIDQFIATGMGKKVDEISVAVAQFKAQGGQLVELAKAAGDTALVNRLERAMDAYRGVLVAQQRVDRAQEKVDARRDVLRESYEREADALRGVIDQNRAFAESIKQFKQSLLLDSNLSPLSPQDRLLQAQSQFQQTSQAAIGGDAMAQGRLQDVASAYLEQARNFYASSQSYVSIFDQVQSVLDRAIAGGTSQASSAERQLEKMTQQVSKLIDINTNVVSVEKAINKLNKDMATLLAAQLDQQKDTNKAIKGQSREASQQSGKRAA